MPGWSFEFATAGRILFGSGRVIDAISAAKQMGSRALLVTGRSAKRTAEFEKNLADAELLGLAIR